MRGRWRRASSDFDDRAVWQAASMLLAYPDGGNTERLEIATQLIGHVRGSARKLLEQTVGGLLALTPEQAAQDYVDTFDLSKRTTMYLTFWTDGDTRNRGAAMHGFAAAYRASGVEPPKNEAPDHLPVVLEFAARVDPDVGRELLAAHRVPIDVLSDALGERGSVYAGAVAAVRATLPMATEVDEQRARRLAQSGPPTEAVGLQPFTLTVPPRRHEGVG